MKRTWKKLIGRLHGLLNKNSENVRVIEIEQLYGSNESIVHIADDTLFLNQDGVEYCNIDISTIDIDSLVDALNWGPYTSTSITYGSDYDGAFLDDGGWVLQLATVGGGTLRLNSGGSQARAFRSKQKISIGKLHRISYEVIDNSGVGDLYWFHSTLIPLPSTVGVHEKFIFTSVGNILGFASDGVNATDITIKDFVVEEHLDYEATLLDSAYGSFLARGLFEDGKHDITDDPYLYYPDNLLVNEMRTYGWSLDEQWERIALADDQLYLDTASGEWLDFWGKTYMGVSRYQGESDDDYSLRIIGELIRPTQNNKALEEIVLDALGVEIDIVDAWPIRGSLDPADQDYAMARFLLGMSIPNDLTSEEAAELIERIKTIVRSRKAAGTSFTDDVLVSDINPLETISIAEAVALVIIAGISESLPGDYLEYGDSLRYGGSPMLQYGNSDEIVEQVTVNTLDASDDSVITTDVYGG